MKSHKVFAGTWYKPWTWFNWETINHFTSIDISSNVEWYSKPLKFYDNGNIEATDAKFRGIDPSLDKTDFGFNDKEVEI